MALEMRAECERCRQQLGPEEVAFVCSFECTYCPDCAEVLGGVCATCAGELVRRPRRSVSRSTPQRGVPAAAAAARTVSPRTSPPESEPAPLGDR